MAIILTKGKKWIIGVIHLPPLPGTPYYREGDLEKAVEKAKRCVNALMEGGAGGCLLQPLDRAYHVYDDADYARVSAMTVIGTEIRKEVDTDFQVGIQLLWNGVTPALAVAKVCGADFIRCSAVCGTVDTPYGTIEADADRIMSYRRRINAFQIGISAEVAGYHVTNDDTDEKNFQARARNIAFAGADMLEVYNPDPRINDKLIKSLRSVVKEIPIILGGGTGTETVKERLKLADGAYVGSCFEDGSWGGEMNGDIIRRYMEKVRELEETV